MPHSPAGRALAAVQARGPGADLEAGENLDADVEAALDPRRASSSRFGGVEQTLQGVRELVWGQARLLERSGIAGEHFLQVLVLPEEAGLRELDEPLAALELVDGDGRRFAIRG